MAGRNLTDRPSTERTPIDGSRTSINLERGLLAIDGSHINVRDIHNHNYGSSHGAWSLLAIAENLTDGEVTEHGLAQPREPSLQELLHFPEMASREHNITDLHDGTGRWLLQTSQYSKWAPRVKEKRQCGCIPVKRSNNEGQWKHHLLWIMGNAGAGKSSLMKMAVENAKAKYRNALILPHFFNARGSVLERSAEGMYRTLVSWLLEKLPNRSVEELRSSLGPATPRKWGIPQLARLLRTAVEKLSGRPVMFFIDALDECKEDEVHAMLKVFRDLVKLGYESEQQIRVCFASRPYPHFGFKDAEYLDLGAHEEHNKDIVKYIHDELHIGNSTIAKEVRKEMQTKAAGIFMWVVLVVGILNKDYNHGNVGELQRRLVEIPPGLHDLFRYTLDRYPEDRNTLLVCFQWLLFGQESLRVDRLWWGVQLGLGRSDAEIVRDYEEMSFEDMERSILNVSKGLVEFKFSKKGGICAQFVHESVRNFIFKEGELQQLYGTEYREDFEAQSHEQLRDWCVAEMAARRPRLLQQIEQKQKRELQHQDLEEMGWCPVAQASRTRFPCAGYAAVQVMKHAQCALKSGRSQASFLERFAAQLGPYFLSPNLMNSLVSFTIPIYRDLISLLVDGAYGTLIRETQLHIAQSARDRGEAFGLKDAISYRSPVIAALLFETFGGINALVDIYLQLNKGARQPKLQKILQQLAESWNDRDLWYRRPHDDPLLNVAITRPLLATFFLIAMAPPKLLAPHLDTLESFVKNTTGSLLTFLLVLGLFISRHLRSDAIDCGNPKLLQWVMVSNLAYGRNAHAPGDDDWDIAEDRKIAQLFVGISESLRSRLPPHQIPLPSPTDDEDLVLPPSLSPQGTDDEGLYYDSETDSN